MRTEQIRCILCNKHLDISIQSGKEMFICAECQAYFCPDCLQAIKNFSHCPAARLLGVNEHELKFIKLLPPKLPSSLEIQEKPQKAKTIKILPNKSVKVIEEDKITKKKVKDKKSA